MSGRPATAVDDALKVLATVHRVSATSSAYWRITEETGLCADVLAHHVSAKPVGQAAVATLAEMRQVPGQCLQVLRNTC